MINEIQPDMLAMTYREAIKKDITQKRFNINLLGVIASNDLASAQYASYTEKLCQDVGIKFSLHSCDKHDVAETIKKANEDSSVHGIFVYYPILGGEQDQALKNLICPSKDIEGLSSYWLDKLYANDRKNEQHMKSILPCTPLAIIKLLSLCDRVYAPYGLPLQHQTITIFNRSDVVGRPLAHMLSNDGAMVYSFDEHGGTIIPPQGQQIAEGSSITRSLALQQSDIVITGVPSDKFEKIKASELHPGVVGVNFSFINNFSDEAKIFVDTYIPRVGALTVAMCLRNALRLFQNYHI